MRITMLLSALIFIQTACQADVAQPTLPTPTPVKVIQSTSTPEPSQAPTVTVTPPAEPTLSLMLTGQMAYINGSPYAVVEINPLVPPECCPAISPDGQKVAFGTYMTNPQKIYVQSNDGSDLKEVSSLEIHHGDGPFPDPVWSPDGQYLAFVNYDEGIYLVKADGTNLTRLEPKGFDPAWSPDGTSLAFASSDRDIYVMDSAVRQPRQLTTGEAFEQRPAWSPDGQSIAFVSDSYDHDVNYEIYVMNSDGSNQCRLTNNTANDWGPVFSPDGRYIVFSSDRDGHNGIYVMNSDGSEQRWLMAAEAPQRWRPDTTRVRFVEDVQDVPPLPEEIRQGVVFTLAQQFRVRPDEIELVSWQQTTWPNGCLGIDRRQPCPQGETPGYRLRLRIKGVPYEFRSPASDPLNLRLAVGPAVDIEEVLLWEGEPALFGGAEEGSCLSFSLSAAGQGALGVCDGPQRAVELTGEQFARLELWHDWLLRFAYFEADTPHGRVVFQAHSLETASPAWQRALAAWAKLAALELNDGRSGASWGAALAWQQPLADRAGYCQFLSIQTYGYAYASTALCEGGDPQNLGQGWIEPAAWEQFDVWFYDRAPVTTDRLSFFGTGSTELSEADRAALEQWAEILYAKLADAASEPSPEKTYVYIEGMQLYPLPEQVIFTYQGLATGITSEFQPASPNVSGPTGPTPDLAYPTHLRFYFLDAPPAGALAALGGRPQLRIYPVNDYRLLYWHEGLQPGTPGYIINQTIDRLQAMLADRPEAGEGGLPLLPPQHNSQVFKAQLKYLDFEDGAGIRFITQHASGGPINNQDIFYTFQGITTDGQYYVTLFYPISTTALAEFSRDNTFETLADFQTHVQETSQRLDVLPPEDFAPDLSMLDALIQSLQIRSTP